MFKSAFKKAKHDYALVFYGRSEVAKIDFQINDVILYDQSDAIGYPILNREEQTITVLGAPQEGVRYEVVIKYNFEKRSMQIIVESSPNNICSKDGEQTSKSITCLPNRISIVFKDVGKVDDVDGEI